MYKRVLLLFVMF